MGDHCRAKGSSGITQLFEKPIVMEKFKVTFYPQKKTVEMQPDESILSAALSAGIYINSSCGGDGVCGRCKVVIKKGKVASGSTGMLSREEKNKGIYLACMTVARSDIEVEVPEESRVDFEKHSREFEEFKKKGVYAEVEEAIEVKKAKKEKFTRSPLVTKLYIELPLPNLEDRISDLERLVREIKRKKEFTDLNSGISGIRRLGEVLRDADWKVTATLGIKDGAFELLTVESGDTTGQNYGACFDIGTTTISGQLVDLNSGNTVGTKITYNKQASFGADVISRIIYAQEPEGLEKLNHVVIESLNQIIQELAKEHKIDPNNITCCLCAGNTTMIHLLLRIDPTFIRREPYVPTANFLPVLRASEINIRINPHGLLYCVPGVSSYVGGDVTAGVLSSALDEEKDLCVLIDIGTNGEIVLGSAEFMISASASAGPAFEGSGVKCGMRAGRGAIQKVGIDPKSLDVTYSIIGEGKPRGICGSGYIDLIARLLDTGILDKNGKINGIKNKRIRNSDDGKEFVVEFKKNSDSSGDIVISEADIENLKRAKAAIYSATSVLAKHMGFDFDQVKKFFIAGGFGNYIEVESAVRIGLLPDLDRKKFIFVGNSSLAGAHSALLSHQALAKTQEIAKKITYFELSADAGYM
ncbi:MAG: ASKHA domain-containing protein, partial [Candidatus Omnitrophica bacterium]|nr:ASKHA domain-containing protein [Candidatus Omnitrophota bacterium]